MRTGLCTDPRFRAHVAPGEHPERPERLAAIERALDDEGLTGRCLHVPARRATRAELERAHDPRHLDRLEDDIARRGSGWIDPDTYFCPWTWEATLLAAGAAVELATRVEAGELDNAIGLVRPPGHHATRDRAMGFCLLNNVAVAAAALRAAGARVAIVDWDVHHGNGTEAIFDEDPEVLYVSLHEYPFYPGTGALEARGHGLGVGATVNVPLPSGSGDAAYVVAMDRVVVPVLERFRADVTLVSAGFDAHRDDPLADMRVTERGYAAMATRLLEASRGKLAVLLEGGYDLAALARSAAAVTAVLLGDRAPDLIDDVRGAADAEFAAIERARRFHLGR